jgi:hypothetical protein
VIADDLARLFHATYESLAPSYGHSPVPWDEVSETNRKLLVAVCEVIAGAVDPKPIVPGSVVVVPTSVGPKTAASLATELRRICGHGRFVVAAVDSLDVGEPGDDVVARLRQRAGDGT